MRTHSALELRRVTVGRPAPQVCGAGCGSSVIRADSGMCDRCTAKQPAQVQAWSEWKEMCGRKAMRRSEALPVDACAFCREPYGMGGQRAHSVECSANTFVCDCGKRYSTAHLMRDHQYKRCAMRQ